MRWTLVAPLAASLPLLACSLNLGGGCRDGSCSGSVGGSAGEDSGTDTDADTGGVPEFWPGVACAPDPDETPRFYFDLRAGKDDDRDYFRLPFPADLRRRGGGIDLEGFPRPPASFAAAPELATVIDRWMNHLEQDTPGFAVDGVVLFRSSTGVRAMNGAIRYLNITPGHPNYGETLNGLSYTAENGSISGNNYICRNWLAIEPSDGVVLDADATYAVVLTDAAEPSGGGRFTADADLELMLRASAPSDAAKAPAWATFAPLRAYLSDPANTGEKRISSDAIVGATVFTTGPHRDLMASARKAVHDGPLGVSDLQVCDAAGDSPCSLAPGLSDDERAARRCPAPNPAFTEIHGRVTLPIFQEGRPPYASNGGKIQVDAEGPVLHAVQDVCFALTVPNTEAPAAGFPTLVFAHGTGGGFRDAAAGPAERAAKVGIATLALEGNLHGERRGDTDTDGLVEGIPLDQLVFNLRNPDAARDNILQGAIDQFTAVRLAAHFAEATAPEPPPAALDPANLFFMGHSQGAQAGVAFLPYEPDVRAVVLSGGGANLLRAILGKTEPKVSLGGNQFPPRDILQLAFQERPDRPISANHPLLQLFNTFVNRSDGDVYGPLLRKGAAEGIGSKHILSYIGHVDSYTPLRAAASLAISANLAVGGSNLFPAPCDQYSDDEAKVCGYSISGFMPVTPLPASGNAGKTTAVVLMRDQPGDKDGHFVAFTPAELDRIIGFFDSARDGATAVVGD